MQVQPYLFFEGRCEEAAEFYKSAVGAEVTMLMRFKEAPPGSGPEGSVPDPKMAEKVMHMNMRVGQSMVMASDGHCAGTQKFQGFGLSLMAKDEAEAKRLFDNLSPGGQVQMPLGKTFFSPAFGMVSDKFGILWMVIVEM